MKALRAKIIRQFLVNVNLTKMFQSFQLLRYKPYYCYSSVSYRTTLPSNRIYIQYNQNT